MLAETRVGPGLVVDHLGVDVLRAAEDRQPGPFGGAEEPVADLPLAPQAGGSARAFVDLTIFTSTILNAERTQCDDHFEPNALPALRRTNSPS